MRVRSGYFTNHPTSVGTNSFTVWNDQPNFDLRLQRSAEPAMSTRVRVPFRFEERSAFQQMTDQDLKNKYQPVADFMSRNGFQIQHFHVENGKVVLEASAPTEYLKNRA